MVYVYMYIMYIYVCLCVYTHTHTSSHGWYVDRVAFKSPTEGVSEPLRTVQITPKASNPLVKLSGTEMTVYSALFSSVYLGTVPNNQDV